MSDILCALGIVGVFMLIGIYLRSKVVVLQKMLVPVSVIGGTLGFLFMNYVLPHLSEGITSASIFNQLTGGLFVLSFIALGLTDGEQSSKRNHLEEKKKGSQTIRQGAIGLACIWCALYAITPVLGGVIIAIVGKPFDMDIMYGMLIPFAFCQGPGQAASFGGVFETAYGYVNAQQVAITFSVIGFLAAFLIGVPVAQLGIKKGIAKTQLQMNDAVKKGIFAPSEQHESMGKVTMFSGSIETLTIHYGLIFFIYLVVFYLTKLLAHVPVLGDTFSGMTFMWGLLTAYFVKWLMKKLNIYHIICKKNMSRIAASLSDFLILTSFLSIELKVLGKWVMPMLVECFIIAIITFAFCYYFGCRLGSDHDFERILGIYGQSTGTTPSGIALIRIVDNQMQTQAYDEVGIGSVAVLLTMPSFLLISFAGMGQISILASMGGNIVIALIFIVILKIFKLYNKKTFSLVKGERYID